MEEQFLLLVLELVWITVLAYFLSSLNVCAVFNLGDDATDTALEAHAELRERLAIVPHHRPGELPTRLSEAVAAKVDSISHRCSFFFLKSFFFKKK